MENNNQQKKIENAFNSSIQNKSQIYSKKYYIIFFTVMILTFICIYWLCNYPKLKELFQTISLCALSIAIAEYSTRKYLE